MYFGNYFNSFENTQVKRKRRASDIFYSGLYVAVDYSRY